MDGNRLLTKIADSIQCEKLDIHRCVDALIFIFDLLFVYMCNLSFEAVSCLYDEEEGKWFLAKEPTLRYSIYNIYKLVSILFI
jgi:hypothetical protein